MKDVEARLVILARNGDRQAFEQLVLLYHGKLYQLGYRMLGNPSEAEEIVQDTFLRVFTNLDRYDSKHKFSTWIYRIATNLCIDRLRKRKPGYSLDAEMPDSDGSDWHSTLSGDQGMPEQELLLTETQEEIRRAIDSLPAKYKSVVVLRYMHDMSLQEISEVLGMPLTTVKTRVHRGREYLRNRLKSNYERQ